MECGICLDVKENIIKLECKHELCTDCYICLRKNICPFCRHIFIDSTKQITQDIYYDTISNNIIIKHICFIILIFLGCLVLTVCIMTIFNIVFYIFNIPIIIAFTSIIDKNNLSIYSCIKIIDVLTDNILYYYNGLLCLLGYI